MPKLRFPGFEGEWERTAFNSLFSILKNNTLSRAELTDSGTIKNIHYGDILVKFDDFIKVENPMIPYVKDTVTLKYEMDYLQSGDIVIADTAEDDTVGKATEIINPTNIPVVSGLHTIPCRPNKIFASSYLGYYINSSAYHKQLYPFMQGIKVTSISKGNIRKTTISYPSNNEQHKIANFLILVSVRIEKQHQLIETLKKYKRGAIIHALTHKSAKYSATSTWVEKTLADLCCEFRSGRNISATLIHGTGEYPVYGGNGIRGYCDKYSHDGEYVVIGRQGALCGNVRLIQGQNYLSEHAIAVKANTENDTKFLLYLLDFMRLGQYSDQGAQPGLAVNKLLKLKCTVPDKKSQAKIAAFLLNLDAQISVHEMILSCLCNQQKALLQQLFI